jgi:hypothetical protein
MSDPFGTNPPGTSPPGISPPGTGSPAACASDNGQAVSLDHVGIVGPDLSDLATTYRHLGFHITPLARHEGGRTGNHCVMLDGSYLELVSTLPGGTSATLARFLARYAGVHILALRIADETAAVVRLRRAGFAEVGANATERALDDSDPVSPRVRFVLITPPDPPEGRVHLIRHLTPGTMWPAAAPSHPNRVTGLVSVGMAVARPAETAAWFSRVAGRPVVPDPAGGFALALPLGRVRIMPASEDERGDAARSVVGVAAGSPTIAAPWINTLTLRTDDANQTLRRLLAERGIIHHIDAAAVVVRQGDLILRFESSPS